MHCAVHVPINKQEIILAKCLDPGWSGITHQNNDETCKQDQGAERETDLQRKQEKLQDKDSRPLRALVTSV